MDEVNFSDVMLMIVFGMIGWISPTIMEMKRNIRDLHKWHAPDDRGRQTWKWDIERLIQRMDELISTLEKKIPKV